MKSSKLFKFSIAVIVLVLIAAISSIAYLTFARYRTVNEGEVEASIAKWSFKVNGEEEVFADIVIENTIDNVNIAEKKLAPGTYGDFTIEIDGTGSEVSLMYFVKISNFENKPTNLIFYADEECTKEYELQEDGSLQTAGKILLDDIDSIRYEKVYWRWEYTTGSTDEEIRENNVIDTEDAGAEMTARVTVVGIQMNEDSEELVDGRKTYYKENDEIVVPFKVRTADYETTAEVYKLADISEVSLNNPDPLDLKAENITVRVDDEVVSPRKKVLDYKATRNGVANYEVTLAGINRNGKIEIEVIKNNLDKVITTTKYIDATVPVMQISPESAVIGDNMNVQITVSDDNFADENEYEYYISNSNSELTGGSWTTYSSNNASFEIINNGSANRYVWVKSLQDKAGNETPYTTTLQGAKYIVKGPYQFDVVKPVIESGGDIEIVQEDEDGTVYDIPIEVIEEGGYVENAQNLTNLTLEEVQIWIDGERVEPRSKELRYEYTAQNKHMYTLRIKLRTWGEMILKFAQDVIVDTSGWKNEYTEVEVVDIFADMEGSGTVDDPYIIKTVKHLKEVVDNPDLHYKLGRNISLIAEENWEIIGTQSKPFSGSLDGDGHSISDITVNTANNYAGLFGYSTGTIKNLRIVNAQIVGGNYVGALVGASVGSTALIQNVSVTGGSVSGADYVGGLAGDAAITRNCTSNTEVSGRDYVGGLLGHSRNDSSNETRKCYATGDVSGRKYVGGLIGENVGPVYECYATGEVYGSDECVGGLVGHQSNLIENTFATGTVKGDTNSIGGLVGFKNSTVRYSYAIGEVSGNQAGTSTYVGGLVGRQYSSETINSYWLVETTKQETSGSGTRLSVIRSIKRNAYTEWDFRDVWDIVEDETMPYLRDMTKPDSVDAISMEGAVFFDSGDGSERNPYIIKTEEQLKAIKNNLTAHFKLGANIVLNANDNWTPIGDTTYYFSGSLDGDGYTISNLNIEKTENYAGLFGYTTAKIKNVKLNNVTVSGKGYVGALAGYISGEVSNIEVTNTNITGTAEYIGGAIGYTNAIADGIKVTGGSVTGYKTVGGIIGQNSYAVKNSYSLNCEITGTEREYVGGLIGYAYSTVTLCYSNCDVTSVHNYVGGLCGYSGSEVSKCYATGDVVGVSYVGGLCGQNNSTVINCFATGGAKSVNGNYVAGLAGYNSSTITNSYAIGFVEGNIATYKGGLSNYGTSFNNSYWLPDTTGQATSSTGVRGSLTRLIKQEGYYNWDFDSIWKIDENASMAYLRELPKPESVVKENIKGTIFFEGGTGTKSDPYIIVNEEQLKAVNSNLSSYFKLGASFSLTQNESWFPLGSNAYRFSGGLDGDGYTISNLYIDASTTDELGLFGYNTGYIKNLNLTNVNITGKNYVGALAGKNYGKIDNVVVSNVNVIGTANYIGGMFGYSEGQADNCRTQNGTVTGVSYVGGLMGQNWVALNDSSSNLTVTATGERAGGLVGYAGYNISRCYATGNVTGTGSGYYFGGLVGYKSGETVTDCYATGNVESVNNGYVGGLIGYANNTILKSYATGNVTSKTDYVGGLIGYQYGGSIENCFATGSVSGNASFIGGLVGRKNASLINSYAIGEVSGNEAGTSSYVGGLVGYNDNGAEGATNSYWTPETTNQNLSSGGHRGLVKAMLYKYAYLNWNFTDIWKIDEGTSMAYLANLPKPTSVNLANISSYVDFQYGTGTPENPFMIYNEAQLRSINNGRSSYFKMANNITLAQDSVWSPVGDTYNKFIGGLDGNDKTITNINIESTVDYIGFFGYVDAEIKNVNLDNVNITGRTYVGGLVGYSKGRVIDCNITNLNLIGTSSYVGGLIGYIEATGRVEGCSVSGQVGTSSSNAQYTGGLIGESHCEIINCSTDVDIYGKRHTGGLIGLQYDKLVSGCYATGDVYAYNEDYVGGLISYATGAVEKSYATGNVTATTTSGKSNVGGLIGYSSKTVTECYATGNISATTNYYNVGGLCGTASTISNCFATGSVEGTYTVAALVGSGDKIVNSYAIGEVTAINEDNAKGLNVGGTNTTNSYWCPETTRQVKSTSGTSANINNLKKKDTYSKWDFLNVWKIDEGTSIAYLKNLTKPTSVLLTNIDQTKFFANGDGSRSDPYVITSALQLSWMKYNMNANYKLGCSFSAAGFEWSSIGDSTNYFKGELDGAGYTISGLSVSDAQNSYQGIFRYSSGYIHDINFSGCSIEALDYSGIIVGYNTGTIENVSVTSSTASGRNYIGLVLGQNAGTVKNITISGGSVTGTSYIGGVSGSGSLEGAVISNLTVTGTSYIGGALGSGSIKYSHSNATVTGTQDYVGCLVGSTGTAEYCYATGSASGRSNVGCLAGSGTIYYSYATGSARGTEDSIGGLVGSSGSIAYSYSTGSASGRNNIGGLVGYGNSIGISNSYTTASASGSASVGGMIGYSYQWSWSYGAIDYSYTPSGSLIGTGGVYRDGTSFYSGKKKTQDTYYNLTSQQTYIDAGWDFDKVWDMSTYPVLKRELFRDQYNPYADQYIITTAEQFNNIRNKKGYAYKLGANIDLSDLESNWVPFDFEGYSYGGEVTRCYATGNVTGVGNSIGGLIGNSSSILNECCATGDVNGSGSHVGGLVGYNTNNVSNSFALGSVTGNEYVASLLGYYGGGTELNCYGLGRVSKNTNDARSYINGLNGTNGGTVTNSYFVYETTGQYNFTGGYGTRTTYQRMLSKDNYTDWDFDNIWIIQNNTPARLRNVNVAGIDNVFGRLNIVTTSYNQGDGTKANPYIITTPEQLQNMNGGLDKYYELGANIDLTRYDNWIPIGDNTYRFTGNLDGKGYTISNLTIDKQTGDYQGLFGYVENATIANFKLVGVSVKGRAYTGAVVGRGKGKLINIEVKEGTVNGYGERVGGLIGDFYDAGELTSCSSNVLVTGTSNRVGGLVGEASSIEISDCYATGNVQGTYEYNGGFIGVYGGSKVLRNSYATGNVSGRSHTGGFFGHLNANAEMVYATGNVNSTGDRVGGLIGEFWGGTCSKSYATGNVVNTGSYAGGLVGYQSGTINDSFATGNVKGNGYTGGLSGTTGTINNSYATGKVELNTVATSTTIGGLTGAGGTANNSYYTPETTVVIVSATGEKRNLVSMVQKNKYKTWDFANTWKIDEGTSFAYLQGMTKPSSVLLSQYSGYTVFDYGNGTIDNPYVISTAKQFEAINYDLSSYFQLNNNINLNGYDNWTPIGDNTKKFTGKLDGKGYTVSNVTLNRTTADYQGLFGYINDEGIVTDLTLSNISISGRAYTGGFAGFSRGKISNIVVSTGTVSGTGERTGGLIGHQPFGEIINCNTNVTVSGTANRVGGLAGESNDTTITNCYATGDVQGTYDYNGGLCGVYGGNKVMTYSYATGNVSGRSYTGGLLGHLNGTMELTYATGNVNTTGDRTGGLIGELYGGSCSKSYATGNVVSTGNYAGGFAGTGGTVNNSFATGNVKANGYLGALMGTAGTINNSYAIGKVELNTVSTSTTIGGLVGTGGGATNAYYTPATTLQVISSCGEKTTLISMMQETQYKKWDFYNVWKIDENSSLAYLQGLPKPDSVKLTSFSNSLEFSAGNGTKSSPFRVTNENELKAVGYDLNKYYELGNNITISNGTQWTPIGQYNSMPFAGSLDGKGYKISGLNVNGTNLDYQGMFAYNIGEIKNIVLENPVVVGRSMVGALVGRNAGTVSNSGATGVQITANGSYIGGLLGYLDTVGKAEMCYSTGAVGTSTTYGSYTGGLIGESYGTITKCYSTANVYGNQYTGGLLGTKFNLLVSECFATGNVTAVGSYTGGLVGYHAGGETHFCYSTGRVTSTNTSNIGGLFGASNSFTCEDCYWATDTSGQSTSAKGIAKSRGQLKSMATFEDWKFISVWNIEEGTTTPYLRNMPVPSSVY